MWCKKQQVGGTEYSMLVKLKQPIQLYFKDTATEGRMKLYNFSEYQWSVVKSILGLLEGIDQVTTTLSGERYSMLSWCLPLLFSLHDTAKPDKKNDTVLSAIKQKFTKQLNLRFELNVLEMDSPMVFSAALYPCFHWLSFLSKSQQFALLELVVNPAERISYSTACTTN